MIYKKYHQNKLTFVMAVVLISTMIFIAAPIANMWIVRNYRQIGEKSIYHNYSIEIRNKMGLINH